MESPPKRVTRARAAAKAGEDPTKPPAKTVSAAATKPKSSGTATAGTKSTAAKRKTRADETETEDSSQQHATATRALRTRPRRGVEAHENNTAPTTTRPTRARGALVRKTAADEAPVKEEGGRVDASAAASAPAPPRPRGRPRKTPGPETKETGPEPAKKASRGRPAAASKTKDETAAKPATAVKKTVKFQEPDKENVEPKSKTREPATPGLRGRPSRRVAAATTTTARSSTRAATATATATAKAAGGRAQKKPLSPKKVTQMPVSRGDDDSSEDELAAEKAKTPVKALMKSPIKPPPGVMGKTDKFETAETESDPVAAETAPAQGDVAVASSLGSPPRRRPSSPTKESLRSPAKRMGPVAMPDSSIKMSAHDVQLAHDLKTPLLQSAAKRPQSPIKGLNLAPTAGGSKPLHPQSALKSSMFQSPAKRAMPGWRVMTEPRPRAAARLGESPEMQPLMMATPSRSTVASSSQKLIDETCDDEDATADLPFSGRLSSVLPRHIDPALRDETQAIVEEEEGLEEQAIQLQHDAIEAAEPLEPLLLPDLCGAESAYMAEEDGDVDPMALDDMVAEMEDSAELLPLTQTLPAEGNPMYQLRDKDTDPCHDFQSESEDEDEEEGRHGLSYMAPTPRADLWRPSDSRRSTIGLSSLAEQFGSWSAASPAKAISGGALAATEEAANASCGTTAELEAPFEEQSVIQDSPFKGSFFDDEMLIHGDNLAAAVAAEEEIDDDLGPETPLDAIMMTDEDVALAQEANDMSAMEPEQIDAVVNGQSFDDSLSEASQEYGDENQEPGGHDGAAAPVTPARPTRPLKAFFTTTKVPLKPADESTPSPLKKRSKSASRVSHRRPGSLSRSATVISYSPSKGKRRAAADERVPETPSKADIWSTMGTPARTPRRDLNPALLRGAVVFVDVHTTEGADASSIFVELLSQMGARCVKTWQWNPTSRAEAAAAAASKVGITHVVYKDGGKRTLEKVRWANGVVHCVGVGWVLDCERENEWLDEAPFGIDTANMPRGGARRRKSMEPKALANLNGTVVSSPAKGASTPTPAMPANRRDSTLWMHTPSDHDEAEPGDDDLEWSCVLLTPVPKTPAPEAVARYAAELPQTPCAGAGEDDDGGDGDYVDSSPAEQALVTRTCPPKRNQYRDMGEGIISRDKDEQVVMRLMAARRKSLQFAPKIGSPLSKTWG